MTVNTPTYKTHNTPFRRPVRRRYASTRAKALPWKKPVSLRRAINKIPKGPKWGAAYRFGRSNTGLFLLGTTALGAWSLYWMRKRIDYYVTHESGQLRGKGTLEDPPEEGPKYGFSNLEWFYPDHAYPEAETKNLLSKFVPHPVYPNEGWWWKVGQIEIPGPVETWEHRFKPVPVPIFYPGYPGTPGFAPPPGIGGGEVGGGALGGIFGGTKVGEGDKYNPSNPPPLANTPPAIAITVTPNRVTVKPDKGSRSRSRVKEKKVRSALVAVVSFLLDKGTEGVEIFEILADSAGIPLKDQYGDRRNYSDVARELFLEGGHQNIDLEQFFSDLFLNELEDQVVGRLNGYTQGAMRELGLSHFQVGTINS